MRLLEINSCNYGSTGNIMLQIAETAEKSDAEALVCYPKSRSNAKKQRPQDLIIGSRISRNVHLTLSRLTGLNGMFSFFSTLRFIEKIDKWHPDIIHLHNLHNCYINLPLLFRYLKKANVPVVWTLHDCWSFTGQCPHFTMVKCNKWMSGCHHCPQTREYPYALVDQTRLMWKLKKKWFCGVNNLTIVTPSRWLADLVKQSYLGGYPVRVINNGIDLNIFKPTESDFRGKHNIPTDKPVVLGVAFGWGKRKGLDVFLKLAEDFGDKYQIVLVGTDENTDRELPQSIISVHRTQNQEELAEIYSSADVFVNPTREEVLGMVNIEALACGTPVVTFETGGSPEIPDETCGAVVPCDDTDALEREIINICADKYRSCSTAACRKRAEMFDKWKKYSEYIDLYKSITEAQAERS